MCRALAARRAWAARRGDLAVDRVETIDNLVRKEMALCFCQHRANQHFHKGCPSTGSISILKPFV